MSGFFGAVSKKDCVSEVYYGTDYHSHLGTKRAGMTVYSEEKGYQRAIHSLEKNYFRTKFGDQFATFTGTAGVGCISDTDSQPLVIYSKLGRFAIATVARINNLEELAQHLLSQGKNFAETSQGGINPTELISMLICEKDNFTDGIKNVYDRIKGSCSILILHNNEIIAGRDKLGRTPIVIGHSAEKESFCLASESTSFLNNGYKIYDYLGPGEIVSVTTDGVKVLKKPDDKMQVCSFLWVYYGYPPSFYEKINVDMVRYRCGEKLAAADGDIDADFVAGIPDSGIGHALGYSNATGKPYLRPYAKYTPTWPRSFMPQNQEDRKLVAKMKLVPNIALLKGKKGIFLDDSIVRGTQLTDNVKDLKDCGLKEMHMRVACPPLIYPCEYLNFSSSRSKIELATRKAVQELTGTVDGVDWSLYADENSQEHKDMVEKIRETLGLTTLKFQKLSDLVEAIGLPKEKLCTHCFDGSSWG